MTRDFSEHQVDEVRHRLLRGPRLKMNAVIAPDQLRVVCVAPEDRGRNPVREGVARPILPDVTTLHAELTDERLAHGGVRASAGLALPPLLRPDLALFSSLARITFQ